PAPSAPCVRPSPTSVESRLPYGSPCQRPHRCGRDRSWCSAGPPTRLGLTRGSGRGLTDRLCRAGSQRVVGRTDLGNGAGAVAGERALLGGCGPGDEPPPEAGGAFEDGGHYRGAFVGLAAQAPQRLLVVVEVGQVVEFEVHAVTDLLGTLRIAGQDLGELVPGRRTGGLQDHQGMLDCPGTVAESVLERPLDAEPGHGHALPNIASQSIGGTMPSLRASRCRCANVTGSI